MSQKRAILRCLEPGRSATVRGTTMAARKSSARPASKKPARKVTAKAVRASKPMASRVDDIDSYLARLAGPQLAALQQLRKTIRSLLPRAEECISYGLPAFRVDGDV